MRYILAAVSLVISLVLLGLGVGQRTIWAPPDSIIAALQQPTDAQLVLVSGETMNQHDGRQSVTVQGDGPVYVAIGREHDVEGWVGDTRHAATMLDDAGVLQSTVEGGNDDAIPPLVESDLWIETHEGDGEVVFGIDLPVGYSMLIASEPGTAAPATVRVEWPFDAKTPLFGPLMTAGLVFLGLALLFFLLALRRHRRRRGPQRRSHRELSLRERRALARDAKAGLALPDRGASVGGAQAAIEGGSEVTTDPSAETNTEVSAKDVPDVVDADPSASADGASDATPGDGSSRPAGSAERRAATTRRRLGFVALPAMAAMVLTGCGAEYWPEPEPSETSAAPSPTSLEDTLPPVALTESQFDRVLASTREQIAQADSERNAELAATRLAGPQLAARQANYEVRGANGELEAVPGIPDGDIELLLPQQAESWPRTVMAVVGWQDTSRAQSMLVFEQTDPRSNYRIVYQTSLASGVQIPAVASPTIGAASLPSDSPLLQHRPEDITTSYGEMLIQGDEAPNASWFLADGDALREQIGKAWKDEQRARPEYELTTLEWTFADDDQQPLMLVTNDGGALVATSFTETQRTTPNEDGVEVEATDGPAILAGVENSTRGIEQTYQIQVLFSVPRADAPEGTQIQVVGFAQSLLDAQEVPE